MILFDKIKGVIQSLFCKNEITEKLGVSPVLSSDMENAVRLWADCYAGRSPWLENGKHGLEIPYACAHEMARLVTLEYAAALDGSERAEFLNGFFGETVKSAQEYTEYACALGGVILKPYVADGKIITDFVRADAFFPTRFTASGKITGCIFTEQLVHGGKCFTRLEHHDLNGSIYTIKNSAYMSTSKNDLGRRISLSSVSEWEDLSEETTIKNIDSPLFAYFTAFPRRKCTKAEPKTLIYGFWRRILFTFSKWKCSKIPGGNFIDRLSPMGVSVYAKAIDEIRDADEQYHRFLWEMEGSELAVFADRTAINSLGKLSKHDKRLYKSLDFGMDGEKTITPFSPDIRDVNQINALNEILRRIEYLSGLSYGTFSAVSETEKTASEIKASRQRSYSTVNSIQRSHSNMIADYVKALDELCSVYNLAPAGKVNISEDYDDSLITDKEYDRKMWLQEVSAGLMTPEEYCVRVYGESEEEARKMLPSAFDEE